MNGMTAIVVIVVVLGIAGFRLLSLGSNDDPVLEAKVRQELMGEAAGSMLKSLKRMLEDNTVDMVKIKEPVEIIQLGTSEPLFDWSSNKRVIVHVQYKLPGELETRERYMEFSRGMIGHGWSYHYDSSAIGYYLNLF